MTQYIQIQDKVVAFGMTWGVIKNHSKVKAETRAFTERHKADFSVTVTADDVIKVGACKKTAKKIKGKVYSAAALFASQFPEGETPSHAVLVLPVGEQYAVIALEHGAPYLDLIVSEFDIATRVESIINETGSQSDYEFFGEWPACPYEIQEFEADDLANTGTHESAQLDRASSAEFKRILLIGTIFIVGMAGYNYWDSEQKRLKAEIAAKSAVDPKQAYSANLQKLLTNAVLTGDEATNDIWQPLGRKEMDSSGYDWKSVACTQSQCVSVWKSVNGDARDFIRANSDGTNKVSADGRTIDRTTPLKVKLGSIDPQSLPTSTAFADKLSAMTAQGRAIGVTVISKPPVPFGVPKQILATQVPDSIMVLKGEVTIEGPIGLLVEYLHQPNNVSFSHISIDFTGGAVSSKFKIVGDYFVKR